ncbi:hypothetical protein [Halomonas sp.]|uniref:hypothetical protein n=1 Tax=Halomonas sp. TaxID=1486246 RepID=UPI00298E49C6|nr:hypothetical protein [Halomonas sp.]MDW7748288.1 hypothetical protein [Halomonas sp.]
MSPVVSGPAFARRGEAVQSVALTGIDVARYRRIIPLERFLVSGQLRVGADEAMLGKLLADEPTGNLDTCTAAEVFELLRHFNRERGCAVLLVTHDPRLSSTCDRTIDLVDGHIVSDAMNA